MNRRSFLTSANAAAIALAIPSTTFAETEKKTTAAKTSPNPNTLLLKDYRPRSIYKVPVTQIAKAKFPIIDMHSHPYAKTDAEISTWLQNMDAANVEKTIILTMATGKEFDDINKKYSQHPDRFELWCGLRSHAIQPARLRLSRNQRARALSRCRCSRHRRNSRQGQRPAIGKNQSPRHAPRRSSHGRRLAKGRGPPHAHQSPRR